MPPARQDEGPHPTGSGSEAWSETWSFDFATADGELGGWVAFTRFTDHAWYQAMLAGPRHQLLAVLDHAVPFRSNPFEVRTTGLWADHVCETPFDHWTLGLETFALGVDDPLELHGRQHGDTVALGFDLEWETDGPVLELPEAAGVFGYEVGCRVHGEVLVGHDTIDLEAVGTRSHRWGAIDWAAEGGWHLAGIVEGPTRWSVDHRDGVTTVQRADAGGAAEVTGGTGSVDVDHDGLPTGAHVAFEGGSLRAEVLAVTPVPIDLQAGPVRRPRALCRLRSEEGWVGVGWLELRSPASGRLATG